MPAVPLGGGGLKKLPLALFAPYRLPIILALFLRDIALVFTLTLAGTVNSPIVEPPLSD
tara:strand:- start:147 stop:323 length:177 start_codon:yes stop_codon:yes gene_type:complete